MGLFEEIKAEAEGKHGQTEEEKELEQKLNKLFYLPKVEAEVDFLSHVITRGTGSQERQGMHASMILEEDEDFCIRKCVLAGLYKQKQDAYIIPSLKRVFAEGDSIHEKWQRLFLRGGYSTFDLCDATKESPETGVQYSPDIIADIDGKRYVVEIKSVNSFVYKKMLKENEYHKKAYRQVQLYMQLTGIKDGIILCEDKDTQNFDAKIVKYNPDDIRKYLDRINAVTYYTEILYSTKKLVKRNMKCKKPACAFAEKCCMGDVCWKKEGVRL